MPKKKKPTFFEKISQIISRKKNTNSIVNIRKVHFGLRIRFLGLLCIVTVVVISVLTTIMYLNQRNLLKKEKNAKAETLTQILSGPAAFYLDNNIETSKEEYKIKYEIIAREASNFKKYNSDIVKIFLTNERATIRYSTNRKDIGVKTGFKPVKESLKHKEGELISIDYKDKIRSKKKIKQIRYRSITYPIFLNKGPLVKTLKDFNKNYNKYHESGIKTRKRIYLRLWRKYKDILGDEFDPSMHKKTKGLPEEIVKAWDIDFLFIKLFNNVLKFRNRKISGNKMYLLKNKWLYAQKKKKVDAYLNDLPAKAKNISDKIITNMQDLANEVESLRRLGALAIIFNVDKIQSELNKNIAEVIEIALIIIAISVVAFLLVLNFMIKNLKKLEKWAIAVSEGEFDSKIEIHTADEIGRLGDIFNHMIEELNVKYHLEKYVSKSTRSMLKQKKSSSDTLALGGTARKNLAFIFSDVRGFTSFSERNNPETVINVLNFYLELQSKIIKANKGDIADYVGDEIMAHFSGDHQVDNAINTAVKIMKAIAKANNERLKEGLPIFEVGIGVHGGDVVVGNIGSTFRMDFACVGDTVNLTARLCSSAKAGEILVSKKFADLARKKHNFKKTPSIAVKGKEKKIPIVKVKI